MKQNVTSHVHACALVFFSATLVHAMTIINNGLDASGVRLIDTTNVDFAKRFPAQKNGAAITDLGVLAKYAVLLLNDSGRPIAAAVVAYDMGNGPQVHALVSRSGTDPNQMIPSAALELVVWGDGTAQGPDAVHWTKVINDEARADIEIADIASTLSGDALVKGLRSITAPKTPTSLDDVDWYGQRKFQAAQHHLSMIQAAGEGKWREMYKPQTPLQVRQGEIAMKKTLILFAFAVSASQAQPMLGGNCYGDAEAFLGILGTVTTNSSPWNGSYASFSATASSPLGYGTAAASCGGACAIGPYITAGEGIQWFCAGPAYGSALSNVGYGTASASGAFIHPFRW